MKALHNEIDDSMTFPGDANTGLWYDKYCDKWINNAAEEEKLSHWSLDTSKLDWIQTVTGTGRIGNQIGDKDLLDEACQRLADLARSNGGVKEPMLFKTDWRFVTGLGRQHPVENGFAWHHALGVPYLPGSSVKGMVRTWAEHWEENVETATIDRIFGPREAGKVGSVIFFDALPDRAVRLEADIMTPHYAPWYGDGDTPGDWHDPVPIPFLTVAPGQYFQFIVAPRKPDENQHKKDAKQVRQWLKAALEFIGAGAKTAVGYGRFIPEAGGDSDEETWENASLKYEPGSGKLTATKDGKSATGNNADLRSWAKQIRNSSKSNRKKLGNWQIKRTVIVRKQGNHYELLRVEEND
jgi:CRISPR-associated protein Cmr6